MPPRKQVRYKDAGVDIDEADRAVARIKTLAQETMTRGVLTGIGSFGAGFELTGYKKPVLVSSADGVGTKLKLAFMTGRHDTIGEDLVNHCVNDIAVQGATPLFFLDYFAVGKLDATVAAQVVEGISRGCKANKCALIGGETAEMPGFYAPGEYDLAGFIVGAVEKKRMLTGAKIKAGDVLMGLPSTGLHTNGYSLARKLIFDVAAHKPNTFLKEVGATVADDLLRVHRSYLKPIQALMKADILKGAAHITGGGITENTPRMLSAGLGAEIDWGSWPVLPIFEFLRKLGNIPDDDWRRSFNLGIGMIFAIGKKNVSEAERVLTLFRRELLYGRACDRCADGRNGESGLQVRRLGVLISGRGSNFRAIADAVEQGRLDAEIAVVISNRESAAGLQIARERGLHAVSLPSKGLDRTVYDRLVIEELRRNQVDLVCLAGFLRLLSAEFIQAFPNRIVNIHPSLLPAFPGLDAQHQALDYGVKITGCTVHFVDEQLDSGPIILQAAVPVLDDDTDETLSARILTEEHRIYPEAIGMVLRSKYHLSGRRVVAEL